MGNVYGRTWIHHLVCFIGRRMKKGWLYIFSLAYIFLYVNKHAGSPFFLSGYLSDLLCIPLILGWISLFFRWGIRNDFRPTLGMVLVTFALVSFLFEHVFPAHLGRGTADMLDVLCYALGTLMWLLFEKQIFRSGSAAEP